MLGEGSIKHRLVEGLIGIFFGGPDEYAENIAPLIVSPEIEQCSGAMFNTEILPKISRIQNAPNIRESPDNTGFANG